MCLRWRFYKNVIAVFFSISHNNIAFVATRKQNTLRRCVFSNTFHLLLTTKQSTRPKKEEEEEVGKKKNSYSNPCMKIVTEKDKNTEIKENSFAFDLSAENAIS